MKTVLIALLLILCISCDTSTNPEQESEDAYFPLNEGNWWSIKQETILNDPLKPFIDTCKVDSNFQYFYHLEETNVYIVGQWGYLAWEDGALYEIYDYYFRRLLIPKNKEPNTRFNETDTEYWVVVKPYKESTTVEAGTFENCIEIARMRLVDGRLYLARIDVYSKGVGRILTQVYNGWLPPDSGYYQELSSYYTRD